MILTGINHLRIQDFLLVNGGIDDRPAKGLAPLTGPAANMYAIGAFGDGGV